MGRRSDQNVDFLVIIILVVDVQLDVVVVVVQCCCRLRCCWLLVVGSSKRRRGTESREGEDREGNNEMGRPKTGRPTGNCHPRPLFSMPPLFSRVTGEQSTKCPGTNRSTKYDRSTVRTSYFGRCAPRLRTSYFVLRPRCRVSSYFTRISYFNFVLLASRLSSSIADSIPAFSATTSSKPGNRPPRHELTCSSTILQSACPIIGNKGSFHQLRVPFRSKLRTSYFVLRTSYFVLWACRPESSYLPNIVLRISASCRTSSYFVRRTLDFSGKPIARIWGFGQSTKYETGHPS